jgi:tRNA(Leu) C34 or U34 (ribose-2'-O)-methylase TrmL
VCMSVCVCVCVYVCVRVRAVCVCAGEDDLEVLLTTSVFGINVVCFRRAGVDSLEEVDFCAIHRCRQKESWSVLKEARLFLFDFEYQQS